jgi:hypothetical protein
MDRRGRQQLGGGGDTRDLVHVCCVQLQGTFRILRQLLGSCDAGLGDGGGLVIVRDLRRLE